MKLKFSFINTPIRFFSISNSNLNLKPVPCICRYHIIFPVYRWKLWLQRDPNKDKKLLSWVICVFKLFCLIFDKSKQLFFKIYCVFICAYPQKYRGYATHRHTSDQTKHSSRIYVKDFTFNTWCVRKLIQAGEWNWKKRSKDKIFSH